MNKRSAAVQAVVLAAGKGTRMKSDLPKVLHELAGGTLLDHVLKAVRGAGISRTVVVVGHEADLVRGSVGGDDLAFALQQPQLGTGHAVQVAAPELAPDGYTVILAGDVPLLRAETIAVLVARTIDSGADASVLTCVVDDAGAYGRIIKTDRGDLEAIVEARDATEAQLAIGEYNSGVFCFRTEAMNRALSLLTDGNDQGEYYLTDTIAHLVAEGAKVQTVEIHDPREVVGINTIDELKAAEAFFFQRRGDDA